MSLHRVKQVFQQEPHSGIGDDVEPTVELELMDSGGGEYLVLRAGEWAMDDAKECDELCKEIKAMMATAKKEAK